MQNYLYVLSSTHIVWHSWLVDSCCH